jgi:hypothetical protein
MKRMLGAALVALVASTAGVSAQSRPDFTGLWIGSAADISVLVKPGEIVLTPYGAERYRKVDMANSPSYKCLPYGPTRGLQSTIYMDGRRHSDDILEYPEWMGHSIGRWDGDALVVDTIGMREETWIDTSGFEHSAMLHLTERFQKTGPDVIRLTVTIEDQVFYAKPFTYARNLRRMGKDVRLMPARCADNENSLVDAIQGIQGPEHKNPPTLPK